MGQNLSQWAESVRGNLLPKRVYSYIHRILGQKWSQKVKQKDKYFEPVEKKQKNLLHNSTINDYICISNTL